MASPANDRSVSRGKLQLKVKLVFLLVDPLTQLNALKLTTFCPPFSFVEKAKRLNYRCRSFAKLCEIDDKYKILRPGYAVVDCGAAPGSWSQVAVHRCNADGALADQAKGIVIGCDLLPIFPYKVAVH